MLRGVLRTILLYLFLLPAAWAGNTLALVLSDNTPPYLEFTTAFRGALNNSSWTISSSGKIDSIDPGKPPTLIVTVGIEAFRQSLALNNTSPIVATLIGRQIYEKLLSESGRARNRSTAIYIEQPLHRQAAFLRQLLPGRSRVGILASNEGRNQIAPLRQALSAIGYSLDTEDSDTDETLLPATNALLPRVNLLLATADPKIYKRDNIKTILLTSYRHQKPVIAFSSTFVNAGALAAIYATPQQIARQAADLVSTHGSNLPAAEYPNQFSIAINRSVADALNLQVPEEADIRRILQAGKEFR